MPMGRRGQQATAAIAASDDGPAPSTACSDSYFSLNPGLFSCDESWSYRDLQQLCAALGLSGGGKRSALEARLEAAHLEGRHGRVHGAGLFHDERVEIPSSPKKAISPRLLSPLIRSSPLKAASGNLSPQQRASSSAARAPGTPSILRRESSYDGTPRSHRAIKKTPSLRFSPYNKVHVIDHGW